MDSEEKSVNFVRITKLFLTIFVIIFQIVLFIYAGIFFNQFMAYFTLSMRIISICMALYVICSTNSSANKISWVFFILVLPAAGVFLYLLFGGTRFGHVLGEKIVATREKSQKYLVQDESVLEEIEDDTVKSQLNLIGRAAGYPVYKNTQVTYLKLGEIYFEKMLEEIEKAEKFIFLEYFIVADGTMYDKLLNALSRKAKEGVDVRFIYDPAGSIAVLPKDFKARCRNNGIKLRPFNPFTYNIYSYGSYRSHRKITVIDGNVGFTGGINIGDEYINVNSKLGHWKDMGVMLKGDGVFSLTVMFLDGWKLASDEDTNAFDYKPTINVESEGVYVAPFDDAPLDSKNPAHENYRKIINSATDYIYITTPYLIIDTEMISCLCLAAKSGVDVRILTPHTPDKKIIFQSTRAHYKDLLESGVKIFEYKPGFVHGKVLVTDDKVSFVGSINFDYRSLAWNYEIGAYIYNEDFAIEVREDLIENFDKSIEITYEDFKKQNILIRAMQAVLRLISPLL